MGWVGPSSSGRSGFRVDGTHLEVGLPESTCSHSKCRNNKGFLKKRLLLLLVCVCLEVSVVVVGGNLLLANMAIPSIDC